MTSLYSRCVDCNASSSSVTLYSDPTDGTRMKCGRCWEKRSTAASDRLATLTALAGELREALFAQEERNSYDDQTEHALARAAAVLDGKEPT